MNSVNTPTEKAPGWFGGRIGGAELRRRVWHMSPGLLPFVLWAFPHRDPISPFLWGIMVATVVGLSLNILLRYRLIAREGDRQRLAATAGYAVSVLVTLLLFPSHAELGLTVLAVLAFGDGSATFGGLLFGGPRLPWNAEKSWSGFVCFLVVGGVAAGVVYWGERYFNPETASPPIPFGTALVCGAAAALAGAAAESIPSRINDNIRVGVASAVVITAMHGFLVGWG